MGKKKITLDWWSVIVGTGLMVLVKVGLLNHIPW